MAKIAKKVGSVKKLAELLGISQSYASNFMSGDRDIPIKYIKKLVKLSEGEVTKKDLRPDVYDD